MVRLPWWEYADGSHCNDARPTMYFPAVMYGVSTETGDVWQKQQMSPPDYFVKYGFMYGVQDLYFYERFRGNIFRQTTIDWKPIVAYHRY